MRRLFIKFILAFWLAFAAISATVTGAAWLIRQSNPDWPYPARTHDQEPPPLRMVSALLREGHLDSVRQILPLLRRDRMPEVRVIDPQGRDLAPVMPYAHVGFSEVIRTPSGERYTVMMVFREDDPGPPHGPPPPPPLSLWLPIVAAILGSLSFSAWLAWYMVRPVRTVRFALRALARGNLDTRIGQSMGSRRDELADLGQDFDRTAQRLQQQIGAQQRLLYDVSHELRSPLARLQAAVGLVRLNPENLDGTLSRIERECQRLDRLVGEVLTLSRLESGVRAAQQAVDLIELLQSIIEDAEFEASALGCTVHAQLCDSHVMHCQAELLHRSFENIIRNALRYTAPGTTVDILAEARADGLQISVRDRGPGVPEDALERIFEPFQRVETQNGPSGYGLGLAIARRAIASHGGSIWAERADGGGLRVVIRLPRNTPADT